MAALSVATARILPNSPAFNITDIPTGDNKSMLIEHPTGAMGVKISLGKYGMVKNAAIIRTARKLFDGEIFARA